MWDFVKILINIYLDQEFLNQSKWPVLVVIVLIFLHLKINFTVFHTKIIVFRSTQSSSRSVRIKHSGMVNSDHVKLSAKPSITTSCQDSELGDGYFERFSCSLESRTSSEYPLKRDPLKRDPKLILIAASDSCSNTDMDSSNSHYLGLDYQVSWLPF